MAGWKTIKRPVVFPSDVNFASNGLLRPAQLRLSMAPGWGMFGLHPKASRAFDVLQFNCWNETGQQLTITSPADGYRILAIQTTAWYQRMTDVWNSKVTTVTRQWLGRTWWLRQGFAQISTPGNSKHGWGLAFDGALWVEVRPGVFKVVGLTTNTLLMGWLELHAPEHGFAWNNSSESWHLEYFAGDAVPQRVLDLEHLFGITV